MALSTAVALEASLPAWSTDNEINEAERIAEVDRPAFMALGRRHRRACLGVDCEACDRLDYAFENALVRLLLVADGAVTRYTHEPKRTRAHVERGSQPGRSGVLEDMRRFEAIYRETRTHAGRLLVVHEVKALAERHQVGQKARPRPGSDEWRRNVAEDPRPNAVVAEAYGVSEQTLRNWRKRFGITRANGRPCGQTPKSLPNRQRPSKLQRAAHGGGRRIAVTARIRDGVVMFSKGADLASLGLAVSPVIGPVIDPQVLRAVTAAFAAGFPRSSGVSFHAEGSGAGV